ncbi:MAG: shikimate dehydrogenase [Alcaligenaceae bacterium]
MIITSPSSQPPTHATRCAVIGNPVSHSRSPAIHQQFALQTKLPLQYDRLPADVDQFVPTVTRFFAQGGKGLNVTVPFKLEAWEIAREHLSARAVLAQAVNTLWLQDGALQGCNTDGVGLVRDLQRLALPLTGARVLMIGAGGAARGVIGPLLDAGCAHLRIVNRTPERAHALIAAWPREHLPTPDKLSAGGLAQAAHTQGWDLVLNASASSLSDAAPAVPSGLYAASGCAYDLMYAAQPTAFMRQAQADGAQQSHDGLGMLVEQAAESFYLWHGVRPETDSVLHMIRAELDASNSNKP